MPDMTPVGNTVVPPPSGLGLLSQIYAAKQARQNLQTGAIQQQTASAESQQAQRRNAELQALSKFTQGAISDPSYQLPDGSANVQKYQQGAMAVAPTYGQAYIGQASSNFKEAVETRRTIQGLAQDQNTDLGNMLTGLSTNKNATRTDLMNAIEQRRANNPDPAYNKALDNMLFSFDKNDIAGSAAKALQSLKGMSAVTPTTVDTGTAVVPGAVSQFAGGGQGPGAFTPSGAPVKKDIAGVASQSARATGVAGSDIDRANQVSGNIAPSAAAIPLTNEIDDLADQIHSGKFADAISKAAAAAGLQTSTYARQLLAKDLGQVQARATDHAPTDSSRSTILSGYPEATSDPQTIHTAMDYIRGSFRQNVARGQLLQSHRAAHPDLTGFQRADDDLTSRLDPLHAEYQALPPGPARQGFLRRNFKDANEAQTFVGAAK